MKPCFFKLRQSIAELGYAVYVIYQLKVRLYRLKADFLSVFFVCRRTVDIQYLLLVAALFRNIPYIIVRNYIADYTLYPVGVVLSYLLCI